MNLGVYFKCIRWKNLLLISYIYFLIKFILFPSFQINTQLSTFQYLILLISVLLITAAGYIINDIFDIKADIINKPKKVIVSKLITVEKAKSWYKITNAIGLIVGIFLCLKIEKPTYSFIFIGTSLLLYYYSKKYKAMPFIGNVIVAFCVALSILIIPIFELNIPIKNPEQMVVFKFTILVSVFAFIINLTREIIKDLIDMNGDHSLKMKTLPIVVGIRRTKKIATFISIITLLILVYIILNFSSEYKYLMLYLIVFVLIPLLFTTLKINNFKTKKQFQKVSVWLKIIMFLGINSILIISKTQ